MITLANTTNDVSTESTYMLYKFNIGKTEWHIMVVTGKFNYVSVRKVTSNPFGLLGTRFDSFDKAVAHYKNPTMKLNLRLIEMGVI